MKYKVDVTEFTDLNLLFNLLGRADYSYLKLHTELEDLELYRTKLINKITELENNDQNLDDEIGNRTDTEK